KALWTERGVSKMGTPSVLFSSQRQRYNPLRPPCPEIRISGCAEPKTVGLPITRCETLGRARGPRPRGAPDFRGWMSSEGRDEAGSNAVRPRAQEIPNRKFLKKGKIIAVRNCPEGRRKCHFEKTIFHRSFLSNPWSWEEKSGILRSNPFRRNLRAILAKFR